MKQVKVLGPGCNAARRPPIWCTPRPAMLASMSLAGPALSLPNTLIILNVLGTQKTVVFASLMIAMATANGMAFGTFID